MIEIHVTDLCRNRLVITVNPIGVSCVSSVSCIPVCTSTFAGRLFDPQGTQEQNRRMFEQALQDAATTGGEEAIRALLTSCRVQGIKTVDAILEHVARYRIVCAGKVWAETSYLHKARSLLRQAKNAGLNPTIYERNNKEPLRLFGPESLFSAVLGRNVTIPDD